MSSIRLSKKYGLNPSLQQCPICGKDMGIILFGSSYKDKNGKPAEAPKSIFTGAICDNCQKVINDGGVFIIEVRDGESGPNPYRTGRLLAIKKEAAENLFKEVHSVAFMGQSLYEEVFGEVLKEQQKETK